MLLNLYPENSVCQNNFKNTGIKAVCVCVCVSVNSHSIHIMQFIEHASYLQREVQTQ